jgi:hypothetical protein
VQGSNIFPVWLALLSWTLVRQAPTSALKELATSMATRPAERKQAGHAADVCRPNAR